MFTGKFKPLARVIIAICVNAVLIMGIIAFVGSLLNAIGMVHDFSDNQAKMAFVVLEDKLDKCEDACTDNVNLLSVNTGVVAAAASNDVSLLSDEVESIADEGNGAALISSDGKILSASSDNIISGDDFSSDSAFRAAMSGERYTDIYSFSDKGLAVVSSAPVMKDGDIVGVAMSVFPLTDESFVDDLKIASGCEFTVFENDLRVNTTITVDGERQTGTPMSDDVKRTVLENGEIFADSIRLFGVPYTVRYQPLRNENEEILGAVFTGYNMKQDYISSFSKSITTLVASIILMVVLGITISQVMKRIVTKPLKLVVAATDGIASGVFDNDAIYKLGQIKSSNEIGEVARSIENAVIRLNSVRDDIVTLSEAIEENDLTVSVDADRHTGVYKTIVETVNTLFGQLAEIISKVQSVSECIDSGAIQVSGAAEALSDNATSQASSTQQLAANITEINDEVRNTAENAEQASSISEQAQENVKLSSEHMDDMVNAMNDIAESSKEIEKIIKTIEDIAFQTNILALNAAVEAARAGEAGKGFAVVADEVRNLTGKSAAAVKETSALTSAALSAIEKGNLIVSQTDEALKDVIDNTARVNEIVKEIAEATQKQSCAIEQINSGIEQISGVVQSTSATAEETAASSSELADQSVNLKNMVSAYRI